MKKTLNQSLIHTFKGVTYPALSDSYLHLFLGLLIGYTFTPSFLEPIWIFLSIVFSMITIEMTLSNKEFDSTVLSFFDKEGFKDYCKVGLFWSLILSILTNINLEYEGFISGLIVFILLGLIILHSFNFIKSDNVEDHIKRLESNWLLFLVITMVTVILSSFIYLPLVIMFYIFTLYSMSFEEIK
jgi:hypothetical protein